MGNLILSVDNKNAVTYVGVADVRGTDPAPVSLHDMVAGVFQWLRDLEPELRMNVIGAIALEHQVSLRINTTTEEERIQSLNMQRDDLIMTLVRALAEVSYRDSENPQSEVYAEVEDIYAKLEEWHCALPKYVVYAFLKTMEYFVGRVSDVGEGFFRIIETGQKSLVTFRVHALEVILSMPEDERAEFQTAIQNSLAGTMYET